MLLVSRSHIHYALANMHFLWVGFLGLLNQKEIEEGEGIVVYSFCCAQDLMNQLELGGLAHIEPNRH